MSAQSRVSVALAILAGVTFVLAAISIVILLGFLPPDEWGLEPAYAD